MSTTALIVLNLVMSLLAFGAVGLGALVAHRLTAGFENDGGRAWRRGPGTIAHGLA